MKGERLCSPEMDAAGEEVLDEAWALLSSAPPSRSDEGAEARPLATDEADPVGSISDGLAARPAHRRPCCPDAGDERCHGQPFGACRCYACVRAERRRVRADLRAVVEVFKMAALKLGEKKARRRALARLLWTLRGRAQAAEARVEEMEARVARLDASLSRATAETVAAWNERDDALMQASAAAERAHQAEKDRERLAEMLEDELSAKLQYAETYARDMERERDEARQAEGKALDAAIEAARERDDALMQASAAAERLHHIESAFRTLETESQRQAVRVAALEEELASLRELGRVVAPEELPGLLARAKRVTLILAPGEDEGPAPTEPPVCFCGKGVAGLCPCEDES